VFHTRIFTRVSKSTLMIHPSTCWEQKHIPWIAILIPGPSNRSILFVHRKTHVGQMASFDLSRKRQATEACTNAYHFQCSRSTQGQSQNVVCDVVNPIVGFRCFSGRHTGWKDLVESFEGFCLSLFGHGEMKYDLTCKNSVNLFSVLWVD